MNAKKLKLIVKGEKKPTFGTDPNEPWSVRAGITESEKGMLHDYLKSRGINPDFVSKDTKISHAKSTEFHKWKRDHMFDDPINYVSTTAADKMKKIRAQTEEVEIEEMKTLKLTPVEMRQKALTRAKRLTAVIKHNGLHKEEALDKKTPTVEELAKKYNVSKEEIEKELEKGIKVEMEHSSDKKVAREIALDHLGEKMDYYKKLIKFVEETDTTEKNEMAQAQLHFIKYACEEILDYIDKGGKVEEWYQVKIAKSFSEFESLHSFMEGESRRLGIKEEQQLDELSPGTLSSYVLKTTSKDPKRAEPRKKAMSKLAKAMAKQPVDPKAPRYSTKLFGEGFDDHEEIAKELIRRHGMNITKDHLKALENERDSRSALDHDAVMNKVRAMGAMTEAKKPTALEKFRQAASEREKKHAEIEKQSKEKPDMKGAIDRLEKHLNKEEIVSEGEVTKTKTGLVHRGTYGTEYTGKAHGEHKQKDSMDMQHLNTRLTRNLEKGMGVHFGKVKEDVFQDTYAATQTAFDMGTQADDREPVYSKRKEMSKSARMIKALYKKHKMVKEEIYDHEKEDKSVATYGKKPKVEKQEVYDDEAQAAMVLKGGKTLTGQTRDTLEIDPIMRKANNNNNNQRDK